MNTFPSFSAGLGTSGDIFHPKTLFFQVSFFSSTSFLTFLLSPFEEPIGCDPSYLSPLSSSFLILAYQILSLDSQILPHHDPQSASFAQCACSVRTIPKACRDRASSMEFLLPLYGQPFSSFPPPQYVCVSLHFWLLQYLPIGYFCSLLPFLLQNLTLIPSPRLPLF